METLDEATLRYLRDCAALLRKQMAERLVALYATGSIGFGEYDARRSDIDLIAVADSPPPRFECEQIAQSLVHAALPCPATGLDFLLITRETAANPGVAPRIELAVATGDTWAFEVEIGNEEPELLIHLAVCRESGIPLCGLAATELIAPVPVAVLRRELRRILLWHKEHLLDSHHDPEGVNSTLNACRAWCFAGTGRLCSKGQGGRWALEHTPTLLPAQADLIQRALRRRLAGTVPDPPPLPEEIVGLLDRVLEELG